MHPIQTSRNRTARTEVVSNSTSHVEGECEVLSLCISYFVSHGIYVSQANAHIPVRREPPVARDNVASNPHIVREIPCLRSPRNRGGRSAKSKIPVAA